MNFNKIEEALSIALPDQYKNLISKYPFKGEMYEEYRKDLIDDEDEIIEINLHFRNAGYKKKPLPEDAFVFSGRKDDGVFFLRLNTNVEIYFLAPLRRYHPKCVDKFLIYHNFDEFVEASKVLFEISKID